MTIQEYKQMFNQYYDDVHNAWTESEDEKLMTMPSGEKDKAIKDAVGKWYERYRMMLLTKVGFEVSEQEKFFGWDADQVIRKNGKIVAVESDKAQITTGMTGIYMECIFILDEMLQSGMTKDEIPYFFLSSPTYSGNNDKVRNKIKRVINPEMWELLEEKFKYFHTTNAGRIRRDKYIRQAENPFVLEDANIEEELELLNSLANV